MAQFQMSAEITLKANQALRSITSFENKTRGSRKEFSLLGRTITLDTGRIRKSLLGMTGILGAFFGMVFLTSPHVRAEFKRLGAETLLLNVAIGEILQPTISALVDMLIVVEQAFLALPTPMQEMIVLTGILTLALSAATIAAIAFQASLGIIIIPILGIAVALAFLLTFRAGLETFGEIMITIGTALSELFTNTTDSIDKAIVNFFSQFGTFGQIIGDIVSIIVGEFIGIGLVVFDVAATILQIFGDLMIALSRLFKGDFGGALEAIGDIFIRIINLLIRTLNNMLIKPINKALRAVDRAAEKFGGNVDFRIPLVSEVAAQEGREVRRDGLIFAHRDEEITTKSQARANRRGLGNGSNGVTIINYNTFKIASVNSKKRVREMMREAEKMNKRNSDRRFKT